MAGGSSIVKTIIILVIGLIIFGALVDSAGYYTASAQTGNVTGFGRVIVDLMVGILALVVLLMYLNKV